MEQEALGMVECKGLVAMIEAADAMVKTQDSKCSAGRLGED
jgi:microcompartment protein CcmL/EutN